MRTTAPQARVLRLVPKPPNNINADMVAFTVMEFIDQMYPDIWSAVPKMARVNIRNTIVRAVCAEEAKR